MVIVQLNFSLSCYLSFNLMHMKCIKNFPIKTFPTIVKKKLSKLTYHMFLENPWYKVGYQDSQEKCCNPLAAIKVTREWFFVKLRSVSTYNISSFANIHY